jgi:hypothetical protein
MTGIEPLITPPLGATPIVVIPSTRATGMPSLSLWNAVRVRSAWFQSPISLASS